MNMDVNKLTDIENSVLKEFFENNIIDTTNPELVKQIAEISARISVITLSKLLELK
ncbi:hypothetical protein [Clostridium tetani]|uniref:hypothetical protein n=1 Tax=Clostridium tetani TaxID=1513 RepID=UPI0024A81E7C|nr:hypothetical protein [Clostridium tetani]